MAKAVKERFGKPCVTMGNIRDPHVAEDILARGDADLIGMGRGLIADPDWVNKVEFGDICDIRKCISCNIGCAGNRIGINRPIPLYCKSKRTRRRRSKAFADPVLDLGVSSMGQQDLDDLIDSSVLAGDHQGSIPCCCGR